MRKPVRFEDAAEEELCAAVAWYEQQRPGLGAALLAEVQRVVDLVEEFPGLGAQVPRVRTRYETRRVPLGQFPYVLVYRERGEETQVIAFAHTSVKPGYWRSRWPVLRPNAEHVPRASFHRVGTMHLFSSASTYW